jgi:branched-subunit amino acid ABC-type transport system permease component
VIGTVELQAFAPALINGLVTAAFYGLIAIPLVLSYRVSRSVGFVHGGIATFTGVLYWWLSSDLDVSGTRHWGQWPALVTVVALGAVTGLLYGLLTMIRMKTWPRVAVTTFSLGAMLFLFGVTDSLWNPDFSLPSPFGDHRYKVLGQFVTFHQLVTLSIVVALACLLSLLVNRTRVGMYVRAIADDIETAEMVGIPVEWVGVGVWTFSGGLAALSGVLVLVFFRVTVLTVLIVFLRALVVGVLGGFDSLPLILLGALVLGEVESVVGSGVFGQVSAATREMLLMGLLFGSVFVVNRLRRASADLLESH